MPWQPDHYGPQTNLRARPLRLREVNATVHREAAQVILAGHRLPVAQRALVKVFDTCGSNVLPFRVDVVLAVLKRDGWTETRRSGSHRVLVKGDQQRIWAYHDLAAGNGAPGAADARGIRVMGPM